MRTTPGAVRVRIVAVAAATAGLTWASSFLSPALADHVARPTSERYDVKEDAGEATVTLRRDDATGRGRVHYETVDGSATAGADYVATSGTLEFAEGERQKSFTVRILDDSALEGEERLEVVVTAEENHGADALSGGAGPTSMAVAVVILADSDDAGTARRDERAPAKDVTPDVGAPAAGGAAGAAPGAGTTSTSRAAQAGVAARGAAAVSSTLPPSSPRAASGKVPRSSAANARRPTGEGIEDGGLSAAAVLALGGTAAVVATAFLARRQRLGRPRDPSP